MMTAAFIIWYIAAYYLALPITKRLFALEQKLSWAVTAFWPIFLLGPIANIFTAWFKLNDFTVIGAYILSLLALFLIKKKLAAQPVLIEVEDRDDKSWNFPVWLYGIFGVLLIAGWWLIFSHLGEGISSPWDLLNGWFLIVAALLITLSFYNIFSRNNKLALVLIILSSLFVHSYLLVYQNGFGGDRFRHLGSEERILQGLEYQPTLATNNIWWQQIGPLKYPQALTDSAKLSYGTMWSLEVIAAKVTGVSVFQINRFLLPILWSIFLPLLVYLLAINLRADRRFGLLAAGLTNAFYLFQYYGSQGLPASYGLLWLAGFLALAAAWQKQKITATWPVWILAAILMYFNYSATFLLAVIALLLFWSIKRGRFWPWLISGLSILGLVCLDITTSEGFVFALGKIIGAWREGNVVWFNGLSRLIPAASVWFLTLEIISLLAVVIGFAITGYRIIKQEKEFLWLWLLTLIIGVSYFISWTFFAGEHSLARRLSLFIILPVILLTAYAISKIKSRAAIAGVIIVVVIFFGLNYYSGPVLPVAVTNDQIKKAQVIWSEIKGEKDYCVKEDLGVILALEYVSAKEFQETVNDGNCLKLK